MTVRYSNTKFLTVLDPIGLENIGWEAQVLSPTDWTTVLAYVPRFTELMLSKVNNDVGAGSITLASADSVLTDPLPLSLPGTILDRECLWRFYKNGVLRFEWLGEDTEEDVATESEDQFTKISGRSTEKVLEWGVAVPGNIIQYVEDSEDKKPANWDTTHPGPSYTVTKKKLNDNIATLTIGSHAINVGDVVVVTGVDSTFNGKPTIRSVTATTISYKRVHDDIPLTNDGGTVTGPADPWTPALIPTEVQDPMEFLQQPAINALMFLINNIQGRGVIPFVSFMFDATVDSEGAAWSDVSDVTISPGDTILSVLQKLSESLGWEFKMLPGFRLFLSQAGFGQHREGEVKHFIAGSQSSHGRTGTTRELANKIYSQAQDGAIATAAGTSDAQPWVIESWIEAGDAPNVSGAARVANASLGLLKDRKVGRTVQVVDDQSFRTLFDDYDVADWITVEDEKYDEQAVKILAATITVDADSQTALELTIQSKFEARQIQVQRALEKLGSDATPTTSSSKITVSQAISVTKLADLADVNAGSAEELDILQFDGKKWQARKPTSLIEDFSLTFDDLTDVDMTTDPPSFGESPVWSGSAWVPGAPIATGGPRSRIWLPGGSETVIDEFNDSLLDPAWVRVDKAAGVARAEWTEAGDVLSVLNNGGDASAELHAMMRPLSGAGGAMVAGDAFISCMTLFGPRYANYVMGGIVLADGITFGSGSQVITLNFISTNGLTNDIRSMTGYNANPANGAVVQAYAGSPIFVRLVMLAANSWRADLSIDGISWIKGTAFARTVTPTYVGLHCSSWTTATKGVTSYEFIRRVSGVS